MVRTGRAVSNHLALKKNEEEGGGQLNFVLEGRNDERNRSRTNPSTSHHLYAFRNCLAVRRSVSILLVSHVIQTVA